MSLVQITYQNFRSELEKMSAAQRYWLVLSVLAGPACTTAKFKTLATTYRLEMMPILEIIQTLQTSRYNRSRKITSSNTKNLQLVPCLAQHPSAFTSRCPTDKEGRGALEPPPEDFYVFHLFKPCRRQAKQTNAQDPQTSSKTNTREYAAKFKTLATTVWKLCQFCKPSGR